VLPPPEDTASITAAPASAPAIPRTGTSIFDEFGLRAISLARETGRMRVVRFDSPACALDGGRAPDDVPSGDAPPSLESASRSFGGKALEQSSQNDFREVLTALPSLMEEGMTSLPQQSQYTIASGIGGLSVCTGRIVLSKHPTPPAAQVKTAGR
jgi:hypothetical protein